MRPQAILWIFVVSATPAHLHPQVTGKAAAIAGLVLDDFDNPVLHADVVLTEARLNLAVGRSGRFSLTGDFSGRHTVMVRAIGYSGTRSRSFE